MQSSDSQPTKFTTPLKVVPPQRQAPAPAATPPAAPLTQDVPKDLTPSAPKPNPEESFGWLKQSIKVGAVCVVVGAISFIPVPNNVNVGGGLEPQPHKRMPVYMKVPGTITQFLVEAGQPIDPNQTIAHVDTTDLDQEILAKEQRLEEQKRQYTQAMQRLPILRSRLMETQLATKTTQTQTAILAQRATGEPAEISRLRQEENMIHQRIKGIQDELIGLHEKSRISKQRLERYAGLNAEGEGESYAVPTKFVEDEQLQGHDIESMIKRKNSEVMELQNQLRAKDAEIAALRNSWSEEAVVNQSRTQQNQAGEITLQREYDAIERELEHLHQLVLASETELTELLEKQAQSRTLTTEQGGLVLADNLNEMRGRKMQPHEPILEVADISTLDVVMQVPQVDSGVMREDPVIKVRFRDPGHGVIPARIGKIEPDYQPDETGQKRLLLARATLNNPNQVFRPNQEVSVEIIGKKIPLYKKVGLEIRKHINWGKYGMGE